MERLTLGGLAGTIAVALVAAIGVYGFIDGFAIGAPEALLAPAVATLAVAAAVVVALIAVGTSGGGWIETPYW